MKRTTTICVSIPNDILTLVDEKAKQLHIKSRSAVITAILAGGVTLDKVVSDNGEDWRKARESDT